MPLDPNDTITPLQSSTIVNALKAIAPQIALVATQLTGKIYDIDAINEFINAGYSVVASCITIFYCYKAIRSRMNATQVIVKK